MSKQVTKQRAPQRTENVQAEPDTSKERTPEQDALLDESNDLLDEIDGLLEGLDQDLAAQFVQVGGE